MNQESGPLEPRTEHNLKLEANVHPQDWENPTPSGKYNLVVIGAGTAGLVSAAGAAGLGAKVALIERDLLGGDCLNVGCVPSKAIIASAHTASEVYRAFTKGIEVDSGSVHVHFDMVMERMRKLRADISPHDSVERFSSLGVDVFLGQGKFTGSNTIEVDDQELKFAKAVICTGARAAAPPIPGLSKVPYLTNESVFSLTELPKAFGVIGGGPVGVEMAQAFARLGSRVTLIVNESGILGKEDREAAAIVEASLKRDGVEIVVGGRDLSVASLGTGHIRCSIEKQHRDVVVDQLLVAAGRAPNVEGLDLEAAGIDYNEDGVIVTDKLETTNSSVYAAGDICSRFKFTHAADFMARNVIRNALFKGRAKTSSLVIPWATYTSPEVAHVGSLANELAEMNVDTYQVDMQTVDRAILEGDTEGFVKIHCKKGSDKIVAATIVAKNAGDMISQISQAMTAGVGLGTIQSVISPYPTQAEAIRRAGDAYNRTRLTPFVAGIMKKWLAFGRR